MEDPRSMNQNSIMPKYDWLLSQKLDLSKTQDKVGAMITLGVPYTKEEFQGARELAEAQAKKIGDGLANDGMKDLGDKEIVAMVAYLQRLGTDIGWRTAPVAGR
jgi:cytochrome c oxidase cbb3-type subunit I/II